MILVLLLLGGALAAAEIDMRVIEPYLSNERTSGASTPSPAVD